MAERFCSPSVRCSGWWLACHHTGTAVATAHASNRRICIPAQERNVRFRPIADIPFVPHGCRMHQTGSIQPGDRIKLSGGYSFEPEWLAGRANVNGEVAAFMPGQNDMPAAVIKLDELINSEDVSAKLWFWNLGMSARTGRRPALFMLSCATSCPSPRPGRIEEKEKWVESHATYERIAG